MKVKLAVVVRSLVMVGLLGSLLGPLPAAGSAPAEDGYPWISFGDRVTLSADYAGPAGAVQVLAAGQAAPLALAAGDLDEDGLPDLVAGYATAGGGLLALHRGSLDYLWPDGPEADARRAAGTLVGAPFLPGAAVRALPTAPDFVAIGDFDNDGHLDVVAAARGGEALTLLPGDGQGGWGPAETVPLAGRVTALAAGDLNRRDGLQDLAVGVDGPDGPRLLVFEGAEGALRRAPEALPLPAAVTGLAIGQLDEHYALDVALAAGDELLVVHGRDRRLSLGMAAQAAVAPAAVDRHPLGFTPIALALGDFLPEGEAGYRVEVALLAQDGVIRVWSPAGAAVATEYALPGGQLAAPAGAARPSLVRVKSSSLPSDDLAVVDPGGGQVRLVGMVEQERTPDEPGGWRSVARPWSVALAGGEGAVALLPMRLNPDALSDLVLLAAGGAAPVVVPSAPASVYVVNSAGDQNDSGLADGMCDICYNPGADPPVPPCGICTLRAAIQQANYKGGADQIEFDLGAGTPTLSAVTPPQITDALTILGNTGGATRIELPTASLYAWNTNSTMRNLILGTGGIRMDYGSHIVEGCLIGTNADGSALVGDGAGAGIELYWSSHDSTIGGTTAQARNVVAGNGVGITLRHECAGNVVQGNYIGTDATGTLDLGNGWGLTVEGSNNTIGGTSAAARNVIAGNELHGVESLGTGNLIQGNHIGTDKNGTTALGNGYYGGVRLTTSDGSANSNIVGGTAAGARNLISGNHTGVRIDGWYTKGNLVQGNYIGTDVDGTAPLGNEHYGVYLEEHAAQNTIGGMAESARNVIAGNGEDGIHAQQAMTNTIQGNYIGTDKYGTAALGNVGHGLNLLGNGFVIGGTEAGTGNRIAYNGGDGVYLRLVAPSTGFRNRISANAIFANAGLGIDLGADGPNPNDPGDGAPFVPNDGRNWPEISEARLVGTLCQFTFKVDTNPANATYPLHVEFFVAESSDPNAEGKTFLGSVEYTQAEAQTFVTKSFITTAAAWTDAPIVATATDAEGNTSEFSYPPFGAQVETTIVNSTGDRSDNQLGDGVCWTGQQTPEGKPECTLRAAIETANAGQGAAIAFQIPGDPLPRIAPASPLPEILKPVMIDGTTVTGKRVEIDGSAAGSATSGLDLQGGNSLVQGLAINDFGMYGLVLSQQGGNTVRNNYIGTDVAGAQDRGNGLSGIYINNCGGNTITGNVISGNQTAGVEIDGSGAIGNRLIGNRIGTGADGTTAIPNDGSGVTLYRSASDNIVGGFGTDENNLIAHNKGDGVAVTGEGSLRNAVLGNSMWGNGDLGIDLGNDGWSGNDSGDGDSGPNTRQNFVAITKVNVAGGSTTLSGILRSRPNTSYWIEFFANTQCDQSGLIQGKTLLGMREVTTGLTGTVTFDGVTFPGAWPIVTATATDAEGNTSEFSPPDLQISGVEVNQSVGNLANDITLVVNKDTLVRVFVRSVSCNVPSVTARLTRQLTGDTQPLTPQSGIITAVAKPDQRPTGAERGNLAKSLNFVVPDGWIWHEKIWDLYADVNPECAQPDADCDPAAGGADNNLSIAKVKFEYEPPLAIALLNLKWYAWPFGTPHQASPEMGQAIADRIAAMYPVPGLTIYPMNVSICCTHTDDPSYVTYFRINQLLATTRLADIYYDEAVPPDTLYYGYLGDADGGQGGLLSPVACGGTRHGPVYAAFNAAHELAHAFGMWHICTSNGGEPLCGAGPYPDPAISPTTDPVLGTTVYGYDFAETRKGQTPESPGAYENMTYPGLRDGENRWLSRWSWDKIRSKHPIAARSHTAWPAAAGEAILVSGVISLTQGTAALDPVYRLAGSPTVPLPEPGDYALELFAGDTLLASYPFTSPLNIHIPPQYGEFTAFSLLVPYVTGTTRLEVTQGEQVLAIRDVSPATPTVEFTYPQGGEVLTGTVTVTWAAADADGDALTYALQYSDDDGQTWQTLTMNWPGTSLELEANTLPGSDQARLRVLATDGWNTGVATTDAFQVETKGPYAVSILAPAGGESYALGEAVRLHGAAWDWEDGVLTGTLLVWTDNVSGLLGSGETLYVSHLAMGWHTVTLTATDSDGQMGTASVSFQIGSTAYLPLVMRQW